MRLGLTEHVDCAHFLSVENICQLLSGQLRETLRFPFLIRVYEGHGKWAEMEGRHKNP